MASLPRRFAAPSVYVAKIGVIGAIACGAALAAAGHAAAQPGPPVDPALPPVPPGAAAPGPASAPNGPNITVMPLADGAIPPPAPPPVGAPYIPPVPGGDFNNTGQLDFLKELWHMRNSADFFQNMYPGSMSPSEWVPPAPYGTPPPPENAPPAPASAPPPIWPPAAVVPGPTPLRCCLADRSR